MEWKSPTVKFSLFNCKLIVKLQDCEIATLSKCRALSSTKAIPLAVVSHSPSPHLWKATNLSASLGYLFWTSYTNGVTSYMSFWAWSASLDLPSFKVGSCGLVHIGILFLFNGWIVFHCVFIHASDCVHLDVFLLLATLNNSDMNFMYNFLYGSIFSFHLGV